VLVLSWYGLIQNQAILTNGRYIFCFNLLQHHPYIEQQQRTIFIMERYEIDETDNFVKYGAMIMIVAFAALVAIPILANAEYEHALGDKSNRNVIIENRQNSLHNKRGLSESQEAAWNEFIAKSKSNERPTKSEGTELSKLSAPDRLDHKLAMMKNRQQAMESHVQAVKVFYAQLTPAQQKIFDGSLPLHRVEHEKH
jgi:hypothetical protein